MRTHTCICAPMLKLCVHMLHACYAYTGMHTHVRVPEIIKGKFSTLKPGFGMNPTSSKSYSKPLFSNYKKPYMVPFQNIQKILRENTRFTRNSESKRELFIKHPQVNIFWLGPFLVLIFEFKLSNHFFYLIVNRLTNGNGQNQAKELCVLRYKF